MARLFTLNDLLKTAEHTEADFSAHLRRLLEGYPRAIDSLFKITYFIGELADPRRGASRRRHSKPPRTGHKHFRTRRAALVTA